MFEQVRIQLLRLFQLSLHVVSITAGKSTIFPAVLEVQRIFLTEVFFYILSVKSSLLSVTAILCFSLSSPV